MANIVVCSDGTWERPEKDLQKDFPTNVLKVARAISPSTTGINQHVFYDWGLGSEHDKYSSGITGKGIHKNILDGYRYIVQNYTEGDHIYLFGFSRGAYTVRALCGLINNCGILKRDHANRIEQAWSIYKSPAQNCHPEGSKALTFRDMYCNTRKNVHFIGVWDTVGALGIPFSLLGVFDRKDEFYDTKMGPNITFARHALSIDEKREDFQPTIWRQRSGVNMKQVWFAGTHSDIGGANKPDPITHTSSSDTALEWMLTEAHAAGLSIEAHLFKSLTDGVTGKLHPSRTSIYRFRKPYYRPLNVAGTMIHPSVKQRYERDEQYRPKQLKQLVETLGWDGISLGK